LCACEYVHVCVCARTRVYACMCVCVCVRARLHECVPACALARVAAWSKRRGSLMYSHLKTPDHMLKRRAEVAAKKAARKREISPTFYGLRPKTSL